MIQTAVNAQVVTYELQVTIDAPRDQVWRALTEETNGWWLPDFHVVAPDSVVTLDPRAGGQLIEGQAGGGSLLWYTVTLCQPGELLILVGHSAPRWGGPSTNMLELKLVSEGESTTLQVSESLYGKVSEEGARALRDGWTQLFTDGLKAHVES